MAKCLRCGATSEWIEGKVKDEPRDDEQSWQLAQARIEELESKLQAALVEQTNTQAALNVERAANKDLIRQRDEATSRLDNAMAWYKLAAEQRDALVGRLDSALALITRACGAFAGLEGTLGAKAGQWIEDAADFVAKRQGSEVSGPQGKAPPVSDKLAASSLVVETFEQAAESKLTRELADAQSRLVERRLLCSGGCGRSYVVGPDDVSVLCSRCSTDQVEHRQSE